MSVCPPEWDPIGRRAACGGLGAEPPRCPEVGTMTKCLHCKLLSLHFVKQSWPLTEATAELP